jgi:hypothetical protein
MVGHEIINLLELKNSALEDFANQNDMFLKLSHKKEITVNHFKIFYQRREEILQKINKIDSLIERACSFREVDFIEMEESKNQVIDKQRIKKHLVTKIIEQDLEIMSMYADSSVRLIE